MFEVEVEDTHKGLGLVENSRNKAKDSLNSKALSLFTTQERYFQKKLENICRSSKI